MQSHCADLSGMTRIDVRPGKGVLTGSSGWHLIQPGLPRDEDHMSWLQDRRQGLLIGSSIGGAGIGLAILAGRKIAVLDSLAGVLAGVADLDVQTVPRIVAVPRTIGILLAALLLVRLCVNATPRVRSWTRRAAGIGYASYLVWQLAVLFVLPPGNTDFAVFYRAGQEAAAGRDPYLYAGEDVFLNPLPALGAFRLASMNPLAVLGTVWSIVTAVLTCALIPLANRILALGQNDDSGSPAPLTGDVAALLCAALVNSNASIWGHRLGQLSTLTALALLLAVWARQKSRPGLAGVCLALAAIKPATGSLSWCFSSARATGPPGSAWWLFRLALRSQPRRPRSGLPWSGTTCSRSSRPWNPGRSTTTAFSRRSAPTSLPSTTSSIGWESATAG